ncbi:DNA polymerase III subunit delta' [Priestia taiwanensis]|uniref:DNA polymerase III subunit delta' n=1 Tax=Priestia taiwanensis TaxID=1347902 RepID=A0A917AXS1_9BACI|nr:DNA polymerase III subunit delta' [Priestia taiwanensis]MBM7365199.1 DNA polymerase-3 subunit delta' [Priestia taiwanensis]GGE84492.1 DNA polymerase III subunit delta' [Priestia taiwanensis]
MRQTWGNLQTVQPIVVKMLMNSMKKQRVAHAYLFEGPKGTGKLEMSIHFAKSLFCTEGLQYEPCQQCSNCKRIESGNHPDIFLVTPDGLSIKKQQIQQLQEEFTKTGVESKKKLYIIEHADKMTVNAANSLLKFLEEPHAETVAILLTEQSHQLLNTIISRCQMLTFRPLPRAQLIEKLVEKENIPSLAAVAAQLTNDLGEAEALCHDDWFAQARDLVIKLYETLNTASNQTLLFIHEQWMKHFDDKEKLQIGLDILLLIYKDTLYVQLGEKEKVVFHDQVSLLQHLSLQQSGKRISNAMANILETKKRINANVNTQLLFEQLVLRLQEG